MASFVKPTLFTPAVGARGMTTLHFAAYAGDLEAMEKALAAGLDPNARDDYRGYTALHWLADMSAATRTGSTARADRPGAAAAMVAELSKPILIITSLLLQLQQ